jgi:hypothetical protein
MMGGLLLKSHPSDDLKMDKSRIVRATNDA